MSISALRGFIVVLAVLCASCTEVRLISEYDVYTDEHVTALQREFETLATSLERGASMPACAHQNYDSTYAQIQVELNLLLARNRMRPKNSQTTDQLELLADSFRTLEELHKDADSRNNCLSIDELALLRSGFDSQFGGILTLEIAKRSARER